MTEWIDTVDFEVVLHHFSHLHADRMATGMSQKTEARTCCALPDAFVLQLYPGRQQFSIHMLKITLVKDQPCESMCSFGVVQESRNSSTPFESQMSPMSVATRSPGCKVSFQKVGHPLARAHVAWCVGSSSN